ncbi:MAG: hypothetical protein ACRDD8_06270 [Bacteroidales bacterium]
MRYLTKKDYLSIITETALDQVLGGDLDKFIDAEASAEISILEHLCENYEIEREFELGKSIVVPIPSISYPMGAYISIDQKPHKVIQSIRGFIAPQSQAYWERIDESEMTHQKYSQYSTYCLGDIVRHMNQDYVCVHNNGFGFNDIRVPGIIGWEQVIVNEWETNVYKNEFKSYGEPDMVAIESAEEYHLWSVVRHMGVYYTLYCMDGYNRSTEPNLAPNNWGEIAQYDPTINTYEVSNHEYVVYDDMVFFPLMDINFTTPQIGVNIIQSDPRSLNVKKHMVRISLYELLKNISPNNISVVRINDYEASMKWLRDANKLIINPQIPRKTKDTGKPVTNWQMATFQTAYDPHQNIWQI